MSIVPHGETCTAFCFLSLLLMTALPLRLRHRHLIIALHGHQLMQPLAFLAVIVVALVFPGHGKMIKDGISFKKLKLVEKSTSYLIA